MAILSNQNFVSGEELHGVACGYPGLPSGAVLLAGGEGEQFPSGTEVKYKCEKGRVMGGVQTRLCGEDGRWSGRSPVCSK